MTRIEKRILVQNSLLGLFLTLVILGLDWGGEEGLLQNLERPIYDWRAKRFQKHTPPPSKQILHIDMDDPSFQAIGPWPWPRSILAELTNEIKRSGAKVIGFDVIFSEAQEVDHNRVDAEYLRTVQKPGQPARRWFRGVFEEVEHNSEFAQALKNFDGAMLPIAFIDRVDHPLYAAIRNELKRNPDQNKADVYAALQAQGVDLEKLGGFEDNFTTAREDALLELITAALTSLKPERVEPPKQEAVSTPVPETEAPQPEATTDSPVGYYGLPTEEQVRRHLFPDEVQRTKKSLPDGLFRQQYYKAVSFHLLHRITRPVPPDLTRAIEYRKNLPPIPVLANAVATTSFVDYRSDTDGIVRAVPLFMEVDGRLYPQFALMLMCMYEGIDVHAIEINEHSIVVPRADGTRMQIPVFTRYSPAAGRNFGMVMYIPWFGRPDTDDANAWLHMFDWGKFNDTAQHLPMVLYWQALQLDQQLQKNTKVIEPALKELFEASGDNTRLDELVKNPFPDSEAALAYLDALTKRGELEALSEAVGKIDLMSGEDFEKFLKESPSDDERKQLVNMRRALIDLRKILVLRQRLVDQRAELREKTEGRAVIVGWTAVGRLDIVQTSLHTRCPGPIVHGVVFSALMTGDFWRKTSPWVTRGFTLLIGLIATVIAIRFHPFTALASSVTLVAAYLALNFFYQFDYLNLIVGAAAPMLAVTLVWSGCTLMRFIVERAERKHIENRFRSYVDPALVNYVIDNPDQAKVDGQKKELTVIFTDLQGFTTLSEKLQERTVSMLNDYLGRMVPIVTDPSKPQERRGFLNKFLGDGIMFFFGAPMDNQWHALDAVTTVVRMQEAMVPFNEELKKQKLPTVKMRAGINTGNVIVGDAGIAQRADYTVLGDTVNTSARLESANKATGTLVMMGGRTYELVKDVFLCRPIAKLQVVGKSEGIRVYEPLAPHSEATDHQKKLVEMTTAMVDAYMAGKFADCLQRVRELDNFINPTKLQLLYQLRCEEYLKNPPGPEFDGSIALTEK